MLSGCNWSSGNSDVVWTGGTGEGYVNEDYKTVTGKVVDAGSVSALCPKGWVRESNFNNGNTDSILLNKGSRDPSISIVYYDSVQQFEDIYSRKKSGFDWRLKTLRAKDDGEDISPITLGDVKWTGWVGTNNSKGSNGYGCPSASLYARDGDKVYSVHMILEDNGKKISIYDADVQAILASIKGN
jgi:hypothetical protein